MSTVLDEIYAVMAANNIDIESHDERGAKDSAVACAFDIKDVWYKVSWQGSHSLYSVAKVVNYDEMHLKFRVIGRRNWAYGKSSKLIDSPRLWTFQMDGATSKMVEYMKDFGSLPYRNMTQHIMRFGQFDEDAEL
jgi:hypothetical protein